MKTVNKGGVNPSIKGFIYRPPMFTDGYSLYVLYSKRHFPYRYFGVNGFRYDFKSLVKRTKTINKYNHKSSWQYFYYRPNLKFRFGSEVRVLNDDWKKNLGIV